MKKPILSCMLSLLIIAAVAQPKRKDPAAPADPKEAFRIALTALVADAPNDFKNVIDTAHSTSSNGGWGRHYDSRVTVPGAEKTYILSSFGRTGVIELASFPDTRGVSSAGEQVVALIKGIYPDYYYSPAVEKNGSVTAEIGQSYADGFAAPVMTMGYSLDDSTHRYKLFIYINGGKAKRFYNAGTAQDNSFIKAVKAIYSDVSNKYAAVKGTKHESRGGFMSSSTFWYDITPMPDGAHDCTLTEGGMGLGNGCNCRYYQGDNHDEALATFNKVGEYMKTSLGTPYVYTTERSTLDMTIPSGTESCLTFGAKRRKGYESMPLVSLVLVKGKDNRYAVNMLFHDFGF